MTFYQIAWWDEQFQLHVMFHMHVDAIDMQVRKVTNILIEVQGWFQSANAFYVFLRKQTRSGQVLCCPGNEVELFE